jgi:electron transfer flavoprotein alpha subunit/NAD-dependent dihydropyrimidine dehydrogenase PreA subunit
VSHIILDEGKCIRCGKCEKTCAFGCIKFFDKYPIISDDCRLCRACIKACPAGALSLPEKKPKADEAGEYAGILVFAEQQDGRVLDVAYELIGKAREFADTLGEEVHAVILGENTREKAKDLIKHGADSVYAYEARQYADYRDDTYTEVLTQLIKKTKPSIFLIGATAVGRILAPRISMRMKTGLTADCTKLEINTETRLLEQTRPAFGGNIMAAITCEKKRPQMATVRPKVMNKPQPDDNRIGRIKDMKYEGKITDRVKLIRKTPEADDVDLSEADIIIVGGRGLERPQAFEMLHELAALTGAVVGATRPPVEEGWISFPHQIGLSGKTVRPKIYIAAGVSGAVQHTTGMESSDYIIAINKDPEAPIMKLADLAITGDLHTIIPELIQKIREKQKKT